MVPVPDSASWFDENGLRDKPSSTEKRGLTVDTNGEEAPFLGFPFYIAGKAGHRPPTPPLDLVRDGGLPRHIITAGHTWSEATATSFDKVLEVATGEQLPEEGTLAERVAMAFHAKSGAFHDTWTTEGADATGPDGFEVNGLPPNYSAPYAEPCRNDGLYMRGDAGTAVGNPRFYAATLIELPITLKQGGLALRTGPDHRAG